MGILGALSQRAAPAAQRLQERARAPSSTPSPPLVFMLVARDQIDWLVVLLIAVGVHGRRRPRRDRRAPPAAAGAARRHRRHRPRRHRQAGRVPLTAAGRRPRRRPSPHRRASRHRPGLALRRADPDRRPRRPAADRLRRAHRRRAAPAHRARARALHRRSRRRSSAGRWPPVTGRGPTSWPSAGSPTWPTSSSAAEADGIPVFVGEHDVIESLTGFHLHRGALAAMQRPVLPTARRGARRRPAGARPRGRRRPHQRRRRLPQRRGARRGCRARHPALRRPALPPLDPRLDGHGVPGAVDPDRPVARGSGAAARAGLHDRGRWRSRTTPSASTSSRRTRPSGSPSCSAPRVTACRRRTIAAVDLTVRIPMAGGVDSLNVAAAGAVAAWALRVRG